MILPDFILKSNQNKTYFNTGIDSLYWCNDEHHFKSYPHKIEYKYNSRGFRDLEWPDTLEELQNSIWCIGDSFTVGLGCPLPHTWVNILQTKTKKRCINVSMDGASNKWISRKAIDILQIIKPAILVIHWSFLHRDESSQTDLSDENRRMYFDKSGLMEDFKQFTFLFNSLIRTVEENKNNSMVIHSFIPDAISIIDVPSEQQNLEELWINVRGNRWPLEMPNGISSFNSLDQFIVDELVKINEFDRFNQFFLFQETLNNITHIPEIKKLDLARDGYHYDIITATNFVEQLVNLISPSHQHKDYSIHR